MQGEVAAWTNASLQIQKISYGNAMRDRVRNPIFWIFYFIAKIFALFVSFTLRISTGQLLRSIITYTKVAYY